MILGPFDLLEGFLHGPERWDGHPSHSISGFLACLADPTVIGPAQGHLQIYIVGQIGQEQGGKNDLDIDHQAVHVFEALGRIRQLPGFDGYVCPGGLKLGRRRRNERAPSPARRLGYNIPVDEPESVPPSVLRIFRCGHEKRSLWVHLLFKQRPHML